jgi:hypothetical protein
MPAFVTAKFSMNFLVPAERFAAIRRSLETGKPMVSLTHADSRISVRISPADCVRGTLEFRLEKDILVVEADFTARCKLSKSDLAEIRDAADAAWEVCDVEGFGDPLEAEAEEGRITITAEVGESAGAAAAPKGKSAAAKVDTKAPPASMMRWRIEGALVDLEGSDPEPTLKTLFTKTVAALKKGSIGAEEAGDRLRPHLRFEFDSRNLDGPIAKILAADSLEDGEFRIEIPLDGSNSKVSAEAVDEGLEITAEVSVSISLRKGVSAGKATGWLEENGGAAAGYLGPWSWQGDRGQEIEVVEAG